MRFRFEHPRAPLWTCWVLALGCLPDNPEDPSLTADTGAAEADATGLPGPPPDSMFGCPTSSCTLLLVSQTLDDRVEVFVPDDPDGRVYRGAIELDFDPNGADGDNGGGKLDEPFGLAFAGGFLHVAVGHYPQRERGSLVSFPGSYFEDIEVPSRITISDFFAGGQVLPPVLGTELDRTEPIFTLASNERLLVAVFANDLFAPETTWTLTGELLVLDTADPTATPGTVELVGDGGACAGPTQMVFVDSQTVALACDGNEALAVVSLPELGTASPQTEATGASVRICDIPPSSDRRVRSLAVDSDGTVLVAMGPGANVLDPADLWRIDPDDCGIEGITTLAQDGSFAPTALLRSGSDDRWLLASASALDQAEGRGVFALSGTPAQLERCSLIGSDDPVWSTSGGPILPLAMAATEDGTGLAIGAGPLQSAPSGDPGWGRVLWAEFDRADGEPCEAPERIVDLTDGAAGHAPASTPGDPGTWRRAPAYVVLQEIAR